MVFNITSVVDFLNGRLTISNLEREVQKFHRSYIRKSFKNPLSENEKVTILNVLGVDQATRRRFLDQKIKFFEFFNELKYAVKNPKLDKFVEILKDKKEKHSLTAAKAIGIFVISLISFDILANSADLLPIDILTTFFFWRGVSDFSRFILNLSKDVKSGVLEPGDKVANGDVFKKISLYARLLLGIISFNITMYIGIIPLAGAFAILREAANFIPYVAKVFIKQENKNTALATINNASLSYEQRTSAIRKLNHTKAETTKAWISIARISLQIGLTATICFAPISIGALFGLAFTYFALITLNRLINKAVNKIMSKALEKDLSAFQNNFHGESSDNTYSQLNNSLGAYRSETPSPAEELWDGTSQVDWNPQIFSQEPVYGQPVPSARTDASSFRPYNH